VVAFSLAAAAEGFRVLGGTRSLGAEAWPKQGLLRLRFFIFASSPPRRLHKV